MILSFSEAACSHIAKLLSEKGAGSVFHLSVKKTGCNGYMYVPTILSSAAEQDVCVPNVAPFSVYVAADCVSILTGTAVDFETKSFGFKQLTFDNPNAEGLCGCGESFNLKEEQP